MNDSTKIVRRPKCMDFIDRLEVDEVRDAKGMEDYLWRIDDLINHNAGRGELEDSEIESIFHHLGNALWWARHLENRLAKYETHHPDPKPGEASIVKHTAYDPDRRPECMYKFSSYRSHPHEAGGIEDMLSGDTLELYRWAHHLESVREGLQRQLNHFERMYQQDHDPKRDPKSAN